MDDLNVLAIVPARGGSKRIPGKNLALVGGEPLIVHTLRHARYSAHVGTVFVSTDDDEIAAISARHGAEVVRRPPELASDRASSESALLHVLDHRRTSGLDDPDIVVFLQCTSPVRRPDDIDRAIEQFVHEDADSMFSAHCGAHYVWCLRDGRLQSLTYDYGQRPRSQDFEPQYRENGSLFLVRPRCLRDQNNRLGGKISVYEMDFWSSFEIDTSEELELLDWILRRPEYRHPDPLPERIALVVFDFDGVMTDNSVLVTASGDELVRCNRADGLGISQLRQAGIPMLVLSSEINQVVAARCRKLDLPYAQVAGDKAAYLTGYLQERDIAAEEVVYLGNDVNDAGCFQLVGCPVAVADAHPEILRMARFVLDAQGGQGAVRELCDRILTHASV